MRAPRIPSLQSTPTPNKALSEEDIDALTKRTQDGGTEVVQAKAGKGSATLSMVGLGFGVRVLGVEARVGVGGFWVYFLEGGGAGGRHRRLP